MKAKQLLLSAALFSTISVLSQNARVKAQPTGIIDISERLAQKFANPSKESSPHKINKSSVPQNTEVSTEQETANSSSNLVAVASPTWKAIAGTCNIFGMADGQSKPLHYNDNLGIVSLVHRAGSTYTPQVVPNGNTGTILAHLTGNWGATWDSTCIWANSTNLARYPQGGVYNPVGNTNVSNSYILGMGKAVSSTQNVGWVGNWFASKKLGIGTYNTIPSSSVNAQQFIPSASPTFSNSKADLGVSFSSTDDGVIRGIGRIMADPNGTTNATFGVRGAIIVKGTFTGGVFTWTGDTIVPGAPTNVAASVSLVTRADGSKLMSGQPIMAWNESGTIGYCIIIGAREGATLSNQGFQPIVFKTTNSGGSWAHINGIDFNDPSMSSIKDHIASTNTNTNVTIPFFNLGEGYDATVDAAGKLHFACTVVGTVSDTPTGLGQIFQFTNQGETYLYPHVPGARPYIYDFIGDGASPWTFITVDSMSSEGIGSRPNDLGFADNNWDIDPVTGNKIAIDSRLQMSRTSDGQFIVYSWTDSDTAFTNLAKKWNNLPNIKARLLNTSNNSLSTTTINVTKPTAAPSNPKVSSQAYFHYMSPTCAFESCSGTGASSSVTIRVPLTVSNSNPLSQFTENRIWYSSASLNFSTPGFLCTGIQQHLAYNVNSIEIYPNPANSNATIAIDLKEEGAVLINLYNTVGALVQTTNTKGQLGENKVNINLSDLSSGIYIINVKVGNTTSTKKLIVQ